MFPLSASAPEILEPFNGNHSWSHLQKASLFLGRGFAAYAHSFIHSPLRASSHRFCLMLFAQPLMIHEDSTVYKTLTSSSFRKEVIQPHLPIRLPCYDFTPVINPAFGSSFLAVRSLTSGVIDSHGVTGGVYKTRERIHRGILIRDY